MAGWCRARVESVGLNASPDPTQGEQAAGYCEIGSLPSVDDFSSVPDFLVASVSRQFLKWQTFAP